MVVSNKEYGEYATCTVCGLHKYCRRDGRRMLCYSCDHQNYNGLRNFNKENE